MSIYARIDSGIVAELYTPPAEFADTPLADLFHSSLQWVNVTALSPRPEPRWTYDGEALARPLAPRPPTLQKQAMVLLGQPMTVHCLALPALVTARLVTARLGPAAAPGAYVIGCSIVTPQRREKCVSATVTLQ